jgi:hypothetical protein
MDNNWSLKSLHRLIMLSSVYQESNVPNKEYANIDPQNRLLWRANTRRLDFESLRDSLLVFSGKLDRTIGGQPVNLTDEPYSYRRSVYGYIDRGNLPELMSYFDFSNPVMPNSQRSSTIVPQQALFLMNSPMIVGVVRDILARPELASALTNEQKITALYLIIFQRYPNNREIQLGLQFLATEQSLDKAPAASAATPAPLKSAKQAILAFFKSYTHSPTEAIHNQGDLVVRKPLTPYEAFAQALLFANEMSYVN